MLPPSFFQVCEDLLFFFYGLAAAGPDPVVLKAENRQAGDEHRPEIIPKRVGIIIE